MPELPEVETIARGLAKRVSGDVIESVWLGQKPEPLKSSAEEIVAALQHSRILDVRRVGKHIVFDLSRVVPSSGRQAQGKRSPAKGRKSNPPLPPTELTANWIVHLGITGRLQVCEPQAEIQKHTHAILKLESGMELRFVHTRGFGHHSG